MLLLTANLIGYLAKDVPQDIRNTFPLIFFVALIIGIRLWNKWVESKSR
ncbi:MAG: hypothetical protein AB199_01435 [Parcubacteria bacterium C7867-004]|nr:MAG: hypothetical protein AB199_01435 [Parcubacteria bacterium C7867-004]